MLLLDALVDELANGKGTRRPLLSMEAVYPRGTLFWNPHLYALSFIPFCLFEQTVCIEKIRMTSLFLSSLAQLSACPK